MREDASKPRAAAGAQTGALAGAASGASSGGGIEWLRGRGDAADVVLSSRVRLARNLAGHPFPAIADAHDLACVWDVCTGAVVRAGERGISNAAGHLAAGRPESSESGSVRVVDLRACSKLEAELLVERHVISRALARGKAPGQNADTARARGVAVVLPGERVSVMINEEDHLRIQALRAGLALREAWGEADAFDDAVGAGVEYAFSPRFGYLTCCPTNVGTGARFSVMLHLAGLKLTGEIEKVKAAATDMGMAVRGFYGEGTEAAGDLFQFSNQITLGKSERMILGEMEQEIVPRIVDYERHARRELMRTRKLWLEDRVHRALGLLRSARLLGSEEAMEALGLVRLGVALGLIASAASSAEAGIVQARANEGVDAGVVAGLMLATQPAHLQAAAGREMGQAERRAARAAVVRVALALHERGDAPPRGA